MFGWTLNGPEEDSAPMLVHSSMTAKSSVSQLWDLETNGTGEPIQNLSKTERDAEATRHFLQTVIRGPDGRYMVELPWINTFREL